MDTEKEDIEEINDCEEEKPRPKNSPLDNGISIEPDYKNYILNFLKNKKKPLNKNKPKMLIIQL